MIPDLVGCQQLMDEYRMLANIKDHSIVVARIAEFLVGSLAETGREIPLDLAISGALLHDIAKTMCLNNNGNHAAMGMEICLRHGFDDIAAIVDEHVILKSAFPDQDLSATEVVYYADKRVNHDRIVSLADRLDYILGRYGLGDPGRCHAIKKNFHRCLLIEEEIFANLSIEPSELAVEVERAGGKVNKFFGNQ